MPNPAVDFLKQTAVVEPAALFASYADYLLSSAGAWQLPVPLEHLRDHHHIQRHAAPLLQNQRGFLLHDIVFINSDDPIAKQRFSEAHELMETLYLGLLSEQPSRFSPTTLQSFRKYKERWCERGAAELLMAGDLFFPMVRKRGVSLGLAREMSTLCLTSLTATIRRMLDADPEPCAFVLLKEGHKKNQVVPSNSGQTVLWGDPTDWDPPAELRVWKRWISPQTQVFVCPNESISRDTSVYKTLHAQAGVITVADDVLDLEYIKGTFSAESMLVKINNVPVVMALIHL